MFTRFELFKLLNSLIIEVKKIKILRDIIASLEDIYNILRYLISLLTSRERFTRILFILILFYKTRLSRLNFVIFSSPSNTFIFSSSFIESILFLSSLLSLASNVESLENSFENINKFIKFFFSEEFIKKSEEKKKKKRKSNEKTLRRIIIRIRNFLIIK